MLKLELQLQSWKRGEIVDPALIEQIAGTMFKRLQNKIQKWLMRERGIASEIRDKKLYLLTDLEQARKPREIRKKRAERQLATGLNEGLRADLTKLEEKERSATEHALDVFDKLLRDIQGASAEIKYILHGKQPPKLASGDRR